STNFEEAGRLFQLILENATDVLDKVKVFQMQIESLVPQNRMMEAIDSARNSLRQLGVKIPTSAGKLTPVPGLLRVKAKIGKKIEALADLPEMTDPADLAIMHLLMQTIAPAFIANPNLFPILLLKMINLTLKKGLCPQSAYAFAGLGLIFGAGMGDYDSGYRLGDVARKILQKYKSGQIDCKVLFIHGNMIHHWKYSARDGQKILFESYSRGIESGELQFAAYSCNWFNAYNILIRNDLQATLANMARYENAMRKFRQKDQHYFYSMWRQFALQLTDPEELRPQLSGEFFDENHAVPEWLESKNNTDLFGYHLIQCIIHYLLDDYTKSVASAENARPFESGVFGMAVGPELNFFHSLALAGVARNATKKKERNRALSSIKKNQKKMKVWAGNSPQNYGFKYSLVEAELAALQGKATEAIQLYNDSISAAREHRYRLEVALGNLLCARFFINSGNERVAEPHLKDAYFAFQKFGIPYLCFRLEQEYPLLFGSRGAGPQGTVFSDGTVAGMTTSFDRSRPGSLAGNANELMDFSTVLRSTQALSGEIFLDRLIEKLTHQVIENAGAQRCYLFLLKEEKLHLEASASVDGTLKAANSETLDSLVDVLSIGIVQYCHRTSEDVILDDATIAGGFTEDPYVRKSKPKSILCTPVQKGGVLVGILYLENNISSHAFTAGRVELLRILASQAAISIENARLVEAEASRQSMLKEMELARDVQLSILPAVPDDSSYIVSAFMHPAEQVGGDYYDYIQKDGKRWFAIGDVTGHGLNSGLVMLMAQTAFGMYLKSTAEPDLIGLYTALNAQLHDNIVARTKQDLYMTFTLLCAEEDGTIR
ncbi:MAG: GAF domain-containing protein, partial [Leptospiraceae bacterium]|nr:GAF domain-containing protein [Leptospiraceae bacterium]